MRIVFSCGGTGGHITPALAIADVVRENMPHASIHFVGSQRGMENELILRAGYPFNALDVEGLSRSLSPRNLRVLWKALGAVGEAKRLLHRLSPDLVIGTGGYACYPTLRAAAALGIPCAVHESNAVPGLAVRRLAARVDRVWLNFSAAATALSSKASVRVVGNPLPNGFYLPRQGADDGMLHVLSFGGSLGADSLNGAIPALMEKEASAGGIAHLHAGGKRGYEALRQTLSERGIFRHPQLRLLPFIEDMPMQMARADLVICRAGAMSISELAAAGVAAVLIPSPNVTGDHQYKNAMMLAEAGAARVLREPFSSEALTETVMALLRDSRERARMAEAIRGFAKKDAGRLIYEDIRALTRK
ncbi:MAG: undecaprenyldiphospho-muramoylpentapeptide beta-N-acetylglucosaminyltransferase [Ruminococcaceae bacterium]|nr:undecaprenyldiphospho-muramoylpentapeptide beta-N-acetylglucosaminyltransferase [Oscillospiraceae bacterium]